ncbi:hypothetical protein OHA04_45320 (plasmid) [Streptomyces sp. NBC_01590]|uniref:hypothetical protein n=1 Tax=Streptomyces sp. NBC_01590 TaxID=2975887 RepID=UPI00386F5B70
MTPPLVSVGRVFRPRAGNPIARDLYGPHVFVDLCRGRGHVVDDAKVDRGGGVSGA